VKTGIAPRVGSVLRDAVDRLRAAGIATAAQDGELLLAHVLETTRLDLHLAPGREMPAEEHAHLEALLARRTAHEPLQYILGREEFASLRLAVGRGVFIPRPETELLVARAVARCPRGPAVLLDLCTGSGAVACAIAARRPDLVVWAVDADPAAAECARANVGRLGLADRVRVLEGDLFAPLARHGRAAAADLILANPPYIARPALASLPAEVREWEPAQALDGGPDGLAVIARLLDGAPAVARPGAAVLLEIGHDHADRLRPRLAGDPRYGTPVFHRDLSGYERVLEASVIGGGGGAA
jgi:release factor glutamine methyltransferase